MNLFENTEIAFKLKSDSELERAYFLFRLIQSQPMVKIGTAVTNFALKAHLPVEGLIRSTVFDHFCGGVTEEDCLPKIEKMYEEGNVCSVLDYSVEGKEEEASFDEALEKIIKIVFGIDFRKQVKYNDIDNYKYYNLKDENEKVFSKSTITHSSQKMLVCLLPTIKHYKNLV